MVEILATLIVAVTAHTTTVAVKRPAHEPDGGWHCKAVAPALNTTTWPCVGTGVFLVRLGRGGREMECPAWILMGD